MICAAGKYRVQRGDSLWRIAERELGNGRRWHEIQAANHLIPGAPLLIGQLLTLPSRRSYGAVSRPSHATPRPASAGLHPQASSHPRLETTLQDRQAVQLARPVLFPQFKYKFEHTVQRMPAPMGHLECKYTGELTVQKQGVITGGLTFTQKGVEAEYKQQTDGVLRDFFNNCSGSVDGKEAKLTLATGAVMRFGDQVLATTTVEFQPDEVKYVYQGREIKFLYRGFEFSGVLGFEMSYHKDEDEPRSPSGAMAHEMNWHKVAGGALLLGAVILIVADIAKDGATLGAGAAESPLTFAAAARLCRAGVGMMRMVER